MSAKLKINTALGEKLWFAALWLQFFYVFCIAMPFNHGLAHRLIELAMLLSVGLCWVKILFADQMPPKAQLAAAAALILCTVSALIAHQRSFLGLMALVMSCRRISFRRIIRHYALFCIGCIALTLLLHAGGYLPANFSGVRYTIGSLKIWRNDLGFAHYNYAAMWFFLTVWCMVLLAPQKSRAWMSLLGICLMCIVFCVTASRTTFLLSLCGLGAFFFLHRHPKALGQSAGFRSLSALLILGMVAAMFLLSCLFTTENSLLMGINSLVSGRLQLSQFYLKPGMLSLFGTSSAVSGPILDFMYLFIAWRFGILAMLLYIGIQVYAADRCLRAGHLDYWLTAVILAAYCLYENSLCSCITMMLYPAFAELEEAGEKNLGSSE